MCDTMVALGCATADGVTYFAKNSDRCPNEPHLMLHVPAKKYRAGEMLKTTYATIPQARRTNEVMLFTPNWIWGCEMGVNEHGLAVGNEAVFTRNKYEKPTLIGMDYVRLALERAETAVEGMKVITDLLGLYGQGGNCAYDGTMKYDNSYLLADPNEAWILETADRFWAAKKVTDVGSISNCLSIEKDYDMIHPHAIEFAVKVGYCKNAESFGFASAFTDPLYTHFSKGKMRLAQTTRALNGNIGKIDYPFLRGVLQSHSDEIGSAEPLSKASMSSVCMHGGGMISNHTTGSMVACLGKHPRMWATGASTPCFSVFKPIWLSDKAPVFEENEYDDAVEYWTKREKLLRAAISGEIDIKAYRAEKDGLQAIIDSLVGSDKEIMKDAFNAEAHFVETAAEKFKAEKKQPLGNAAYQSYWRTQTKKM